MVLVDRPDHPMDQTPDDIAAGETSRAPEPRIQFSNGRVRRTSSTPKKPDKLLSIFGSFRSSKKPSYEPEYESNRRGKVYESEDGMKRRGQQSAPEDDDRRLRRDKREVRRSVR